MHTILKSKACHMAKGRQLHVHTYMCVDLHRHQPQIIATSNGAWPGLEIKPHCGEISRKYCKADLAVGPEIAIVDLNMAVQ